ncbi:MAG: hypothetical protein ACI8QZ_001670 [Chlamydiales bacterium]|jgi:hypothetical protein
MNRNHVLAVGLGVAALALIATMRCGGAGRLAVVAPSPQSSPVPAGIPGSSPYQRLEIEQLTSGDGVRIAVSDVAIPQTAYGSRVWGHVYDALKRPVAGVSIRLRPRRDTALKPSSKWRENKDLPRSAATDATGLYELTNVMPGPYGIHQDGGAGDANGRSRHITVGADLELDFQLVGFLDLGGRVVRAHPGPVQLHLSRGEMSLGGSLRFPEIGLRSTTIAEDGGFVFRGLRPGTYRIRARGSGHARKSFDFDLGAPIHNARLVLQTGLRFAGQIEFGFEPDREGVSVWLWSADRDGARHDWHTDGHFDHTGLLPGIYEMRVMAIVKSEARKGMSRNLVVNLQEDLTDFRFRLEDTVPVGLTVSIPSGAPTTEGVLSASSGAAREQVKVRINTESGAVEHQTWRSSGYFQSWATSAALRLELQPGEWDISLRLLGYEPWTRHIVVAEENQHAAVLEPVQGRILEAKYSSKYYRVEVRPTGSSEGWQLLLWRDGRVTATHTPIPGVTSAFLAPGTYDFRIASDDAVGRTFERIKVEPSRERFQVNFKLTSGATIQGTLEHRDGSKAACAFYLHQHEESWSYLEAKTCVWAGGKFAFRGLGSGRYRGTLDRGGESIVAEWQVDGKDLDEQRVIAWPLALR